MSIWYRFSRGCKVILLVLLSLQTSILKKQNLQQDIEFARSSGGCLTEATTDFGKEPRCQSCLSSSGFKYSGLRGLCLKGSGLQRFPF